jgi:hypothetical protein
MLVDSSLKALCPDMQHLSRAYAERKAIAERRVIEIAAPEIKDERSYDPSLVPFVNKASGNRFLGRNFLISSERASPKYHYLDNTANRSESRTDSNLSVSTLK